MDIRSAFGSLRVWTGLFISVLLLCGCAAGLVANVVSIGASGKSVSDHVMDVVTGEDCNVFRAISHIDRNVCEPREAAVTTPDVQEISEPGNSPEGPSVDLAGPSYSGLY